jgi:hypothetical protein
MDEWMSSCNCKVLLIDMCMIDSVEASWMGIAAMHP